MKRLLPEAIITQRVETLGRIIGGLTATLQSLNAKRNPDS